MSGLVSGLGIKPALMAETDIIGIVILIICYVLFDNIVYYFIL